MSVFSRVLLHENWNSTVEGGLSELESFVTAIAEKMRGGEWIFLTGDLGAGKTTFVRQLVAKISDVTDVTSPTFPVLNVIDLQGSKIPNITQVVHLDLYRLNSGRELNFLGIENYVSSKSLVVVEWPEVVEEDEWTNFFEVTGCMRPQVVVQVEISYVPDKESSRKYRTFCFSDSDY